MNLIIDIGNTLTKIDFFVNNKVIISKKYKKLRLALLKILFAKHGIENQIEGVIISSVSYYPEDVIAFFKNKKYPFIFFDENTPIPIKNLYKTPKTLGKDRLAAAVAANYLYPNKNVLSIDMGTCIKYDFINSAKEYIGGAISPGYNMRFQSLNTFTEKLPLVKKQNFYSIIGKNTEESILSGVINGISLEITGMISKFKFLYPDVKIVLSGGDMKNFDNELKISIFAISNLVNLGLNIILEFNKTVKS